MGADHPHQGQPDAPAARDTVASRKAFARVVVDSWSHALRTNRAEAVTRLSDRPDPVPDSVWQEAAEHYDERQLSALLVAVATVNVWNRLNAATRQVAGAWRP